MSKIAETMVIDVLLLEKSLINCKKKCILREERYSYMLIFISS